MGNIPILVVIATDGDEGDGDATSSDHESRTGTVIAVVCSTGPTPQMRPTGRDIVPGGPAEPRSD